MTSKNPPFEVYVDTMKAPDYKLKETLIIGDSDGYWVHYGEPDSEWIFITDEEMERKNERV